MNKKSLVTSYITTAIVSVIVVFAISLAVEVELLFRCESSVTKKELNMNKLLEFATIEQLEKILKNEPSNYVVTIKLAKLYEDLGEFKEANKLYSNAVKVSGRSNFALYSYAKFCANQNLIAVASALSEEISGMSPTTAKYKLEIYEAIGDNLESKKLYDGAIKAYQIAFKYSKILKDKSNYDRLRDKFSEAYLKLADVYIDQNKVMDAISALNNSIRIKETQIALYKLALIYVDIDKVKAQKMMEKIFDENPFIVNPYIYNALLNDLIDDASKNGQSYALDYYTVKSARFKKAVEELYLYKKDITIDRSEIVKDKKVRYLTFKITNNTDEKIDQLYLDIELYLNSKRYNVSKKVIRRAHTLAAYGVMADCQIELPADIDISDIRGNNYLILKYFAKKRLKAPLTLIKIESLNF